MSTLLLTPAQLVGYARAALGAPYWYACYGQTATIALLNYKRLQYPAMYTPARVARCATQLGRRVWDCVGLIKGCYWDYFYGGRYHAAEDLSADGMFAACTRKGPMATLPETRGLVLHFPGHIAVYEGNGLCIEERGFASGCVRSPIAGRGFTAWGESHLVDYKEDTIMQKGDSGPEVMAWQNSLLSEGYKMIGADGKEYGADGHFGTATVNGTNDFKKDCGLVQDGIVDEVTYGKMLDKQRASKDAANAALVKAQEALRVIKTENLKLEAENTKLEADSNAGRDAINSVLDWAAK